MWISNVKLEGELTEFDAKSTFIPYAFDAELTDWNDGAVHSGEITTFNTLPGS